MALFLVALLIRVAVTVGWQFDGLYGQDAFAYYQQSIAIADRLPRGELPPTDFFWPNGYPALAAMFMGVFGRSPLAAQLASLLTGAALAPLAYWLCRDLFPSAHSRAGIVSGLIIAVAGQPILSSVSIMADMPALFWATLAAWLLVRSSAGHLLAAGAALALSIVSRWLYVLLVPAFAVYALGQLRQRRAWWLILLPALSAALILLPQVSLSLNRPEGLLHSWLLGWNPTNAFRSQFDNVDGHFEYALPVGLFYAQPAGHPAYLFPLFGLAALWGIAWAWRERARWPLALLVGWSAAVYLFLAGIPYENFRFGLSLYLPLVALAGVGVSDLWQRFARRWIVPAGVALSLVGMSVWSYSMLGEFLTTQNASKTIAYRVEQLVPQDATLISFGLTLTLQHYTRLNVVELYYQNAASLDDLTRRNPTVYVLLDVENVNGQWRGHEPGVSFDWLMAHTTMSPIATFPPYTLFKAVVNLSPRLRQPLLQERGARFPLPL
ncbi:MAG TPA: glycosyltransferase family 39 protein [Anaerolineae bacterium]